jgi:hypothetical protein
MTLEKLKLLKLVQSLHDFLLEMRLGPAPSDHAVRAQIAWDMADPTYQRGYLEGLERALRCDGTPTHIAGAQVLLITERINSIGITFGIVEREQVA